MNAKDELNNYVKGDIKRDFTKEDLEFYTIPLSTALEGMESYYNKRTELERNTSIGVIDKMIEILNKKQQK